jgi:glyoxylase-like metal-dependent hydrolase (beta-lactamase superfamily II)
VAAPASSVESVAGVLRVRDTCNVYVLRSGREAVLIDFGSGAVLDRLDELGIDRVTDVLVTHHHRDQVQGLERAAAAGIRIWVPPVERDLFERVDERWQARPVDMDYDLREDRFSLLEPVDVTGVVDEYRTTRFGGFDVYALPTPGHTVGSLTYLVELDGRRLAFSGDLVYGEGKVWSLAATQWSYTGVEGQAATILSCGMLADRAPDVLLPSHGEPIEDPPAALSLVQARLQELVDLRMPWEWDLEEWLRRPWVALTPHVLRNRTSLASTYALLSETGSALLIDFGYDLTVGAPADGDRAARRPLLASFGVLRRDFGVDGIETAVTTHYHDDHVAGLNLLRDVEGTEVWSPENVAPILEDPRRFDLPCLWFDPIRVDRTLPLGEPFAWHEYELTAHPLPGHTLYAVALEFEADGKRFLATGDQQSNDDGHSFLNYQYRNRFGVGDYVRSAELYRSRRPDVLLTGHWSAMDVTDAWLDEVAAEGRRVAELHAEMLPEEGFGPEGFGARIEPYRSSVRAGGEVELEVLVRNPFDRDETASVRLVLPDGWDASPDPAEVAVDPLGEATVRVRVRAGREPVRRARVAADLTVGGVRFGQQAEALVDVA